LSYNLLLCYTGERRVSDGIIDSQIQGYVQRQGEVVQAMDELKQITIDLKNALLHNRLSDFGALLDSAWQNKRKMAKQIATPHIDEVYELARKHGALGGKVTGAGGGGYMFVYCPFKCRRVVAEVLSAAGVQFVPFNFEFRGLQTWQVR